ncbi:MAG TPA: sugar phosphate isomerase/epimerase [Planctomycetaceae bacterium]|nr:sugar phosphate isomerase/epimerase [Planctomycetaceae bacterium]
MRLGFYTYSYTDRLRIPVETCLKQIARAGYSGIDISGTDGPSTNPKSVSPDLRRLTRRTAERLGLQVEAVITHAPLSDSLVDREKDPLDLEGTVDLAVDVGADVVTFHMGGYPAGVEREEFWDGVVARIRDAADYAAARRIFLAVDGIWPDWVDDSPGTLERLFQDVGSPVFGVNFDPCYLVLTGIDPAGFARRFAKRIVHAHLKDHVGRYPNWTHLIPGRGEMEYAKIFAALRDTRFSRSCAVECFTNMAFAEACDDGHRAMTAAAQKAGARFEPSAIALPPVRIGHLAVPMS